MNKEIIFTNKAPRPVGLYSQAVKCGGLLFISGQLPNDPKSGNIIGNDLSSQTKQALKLDSQPENLVFDHDAVYCTLVLTNMQSCA